MQGKGGRWGQRQSEQLEIKRQAPLPKISGSFPHPTVPQRRTDSTHPFCRIIFFHHSLVCCAGGRLGGGSERASSWGERGWEIHRVPPLTPPLSSPFVDYRSSLVTLRPARLCNTSLAIQTQHPPPPTGTTTTITELSWACTGLAWAPELHL